MQEAGKKGNVKQLSLLHLRSVAVRFLETVTRCPVPLAVTARFALRVLCRWQRRCVVSSLASYHRCRLFCCCYCPRWRVLLRSGLLRRCSPAPLLRVWRAVAVALAVAMWSGVTRGRETHGGIRWMSAVAAALFAAKETKTER